MYIISYPACWRLTISVHFQINCTVDIINTKYTKMIKTNCITPLLTPFHHLFTTSQVNIEQKKKKSQNMRPHLPWLRGISWLNPIPQNFPKFHQKATCFRSVFCVNGQLTFFASQISVMWLCLNSCVRN